MLNFIYNPHAGNGKALKAHKIISYELSRRNIPHIFHSTQYKGHAAEIANQLTLNGYNDIIVMGGDGTIHESLNGFVSPENVNMGIIPCGTGNDFATSAKLPFDPHSAIEVILNGQTQYIDYMECSGIKGINAIGTGIDIDILKRCYSNKLLKGKLKYIISTVASLIHYKCTQIQAITDHTASYHNFFIMCAGNGKYFGGGIPIAPDAKINDGSLDFILVNDMSGIKKPGAFFKLLCGKITELPQTVFQKTTSARAVSNGLMDVQIDGEIYENLKFDVKIVHNKLRLFV